MKPIEVYQAFGQAQMSGTDAWKQFVTDDVTFTGPAAQASGLAEFTDLMAGFLPMVRGAEVHQVLESGDYVLTQISMDVAMPTGSTIRLDMSEWVKVENDKIKSFKVYYDAEEFRRHQSSQED